ncbi:MAG: LysR family transcriptional regulator [Burkholderiales bacterium]|nr:LysR family transcriptional regulator [Burkholderiales bacterium]
MDLKQLEYFVRVADLGSFSRAASALGVAQPALSRQVRLLEVELRHTLLIRNGRGATPTEAGNRMIEHARGLLHQAQRAREDMAGMRGSLAGRVAIGLPTTVARTLTVPLTRTLRTQMPDATFSISEGLSASLLDGLTAGRLDVVALYNAQPVPEIELQNIGDEELFLISPRPPGSERSAPPDPLPLSRLPEYPLVIPSRPNAIRMHVESALATIGARPSIALEIDGVPAILDLVIDGAGHALLSAQAVASTAHPGAYQLRQITHPPLLTRLSLATSSQRASTRTQQTATRILESLLRDSLMRR